MGEYFALGLGLGTKGMHHPWLEVFYPEPLLHPDPHHCEWLLEKLPELEKDGSVVIDSDNLKLLAPKLKSLFNTRLNQVFFDPDTIAKPQEMTVTSKPSWLITLIPKDMPLSSIPEAYLKLHLLSHRLVKPHTLNLNGLFATLPNVAWTNEGAIEIQELAHRRCLARQQGRWLNVFSVDKFPKMTDYVVPTGVRVADSARVRLGAYLGEGTTVMHEGFVNFNAGTQGPAMIEGRISAGVWVGRESDLGGGCSTMGTLSGGGDTLISVGENCLIGANAGIGIPLGDRCTVESGLYITSGTKVKLLDQNDEAITICKARELSGQSDLVFRRHSQTGAIECLAQKSEVGLNADLHTHN